MQQSTFFRRQAFLDVGGFNIENRTCWDAELLVDFGLSCKKFKLVRDYWSVFTIHDSSISGSQKLQKEYLRDCHRIFKKIIGREPKRIDVIFRLVARLQKWLLDPVGFIFRISDCVIKIFRNKITHLK
ncbi:hypothetical protein QUF72_02905 [Desulfobacterales bacterium HSG2]|nr:hypothetical protein [Desulfobacterales bacterium HSG2]